MTTPNSGVRRTALSVLAVGAAGLLSACSAGQITQTSSQVAPVDGGFASSEDLSVDNFRVVVGDEHISDPGGEGRVGFSVSYTGSTLAGDDGVELEAVQVDGQEADIVSTQPFQRNCTLTAHIEEESELPEVEDDPAGTCIRFAEVTLPDTSDLRVGVSVPGSLSFSNGDEIEILTGIVVEDPEPDSFEREEDSATYPEHMAH